jgi:hypothetical protein
LPLTLTGDDDDDGDDSTTSTITTTSLWEMQTAVTTFERCQKQTRELDKDDATTTTTQTTTTPRTERVELHAQLHFGDEEYFEYYNSPEFNANRTILYELLVDEQLLMYNTNNVVKETNRPQLYRVLKTSANNKKKNDDIPVISASIQDQATARQYGWACQVNALALSYARSNWIHADLTRQEFLDKAALQNQEQRQIQSTQNKQQPQQQPLWQVVAQHQSTGSNLLRPWGRSAAATEAATALLVGPPILSDGGAPRRLFSNLFLPGTGLVQALRAVLWLMVPSPEISILLLDWSSIVIVDNNNINKNANSVRGGRAGGGGLSPISLPLLQALGRGRLDQVRRLIFGQVVLMGATQSISSSRESLSSSRADWTLLIQQRNDHAMEVLRETLRDDDDAESTKVLLYGCSHCTDLHDQIMNEGFRPVKKEWRTAWSVPVIATACSFDTASPSITGTSPTSLLPSITSSSSLMAICILMLAYFVIGGLDWTATLQDMAQSADQGDGLGVTADALLYLVRHVLLYLGLSKFLLDWGGTTAMATTTADASSMTTLDDV